MAKNETCRVIELKEVPDDQLREALQAVMDHLRVELVQTKGPDFTDYHVRPIFC